MEIRLKFDWDPAKAAANEQKHAVTFRRAMEVLYDPGAFTEFDWDNSTDENRWRTIGLDKDGYPIFVVHTYDDTLPEEHLVRIISARRLTKREAQNYWKERSP